MQLARIDATGSVNTFIVGSGALRVTDPCYDIGTWCAGTLEGVRNGAWRAHVGYHEDGGGWGTRVAYLHIVHADESDPHFDPDSILPSTFEDSGITVGVDSGQAGFFDHALFAQVCDCGALKEKFYDEVCRITSELPDTVVHAIGAVSSSGYGDGCYECFVRRVDGQVVEAILVFLTEEEECEEEGQQ